MFKVSILQLRLRKAMPSTTTKMRWCCRTPFGLNLRIAFSTSRLVWYIFKALARFLLLLRIGFKFSLVKFFRLKNSSEDAYPEHVTHLVPKWSFALRMFKSATSRMEAVRQKVSRLVRFTILRSRV